MEGPFKDTNIIREGGTEEPRLRRMENPSFSVILFFHCAASAPSLPPFLLHIFSRPNGLRRCYGQGFLFKCDKEPHSDKVPLLGNISHFEMRRRFDNPCEEESLHDWTGSKQCMKEEGRRILLRTYLSWPRMSKQNDNVSVSPLLQGHFPSISQLYN